mgnify:CR=1 FL=1
MIAGVAVAALVVPKSLGYAGIAGEMYLRAGRLDLARPQIEGILRTMYDPRNSLTNEVSAQLHEHFGDKVYRTVVPRNVRLAEAPSHGIPALLYDRYSRGAKAYMALAGEIIRREEKIALAGQADAIAIRE